jgi:transcriptional regulator with XRE-family HTH domain
MTFGTYLREARLKAGIKTQKEAASRLTALGRKTSQGLLAQYEAGKIKNPDPSVLRFLAEIYGQDYMEVVFHLIRDKYGPEGGWAEPGIAHERLKLWEASVQPIEPIDGVDGLEVYQLKAKAALVRETILNVKGLAEWERNIPQLEILWIVATDSLNDKGSQILESVVHNMRRGVQMIYFLREEDIKEGGRFWELQLMLEHMKLRPDDGKPLNPPLAVPLDRDQLKWLSTDIIIANPHWRDHAAGFRYIRRARVGAYAIRMRNRELNITIGHLRRCAPVAFKNHPINQSNDALQIILYEKMEEYIN